MKDTLVFEVTEYTDGTYRIETKHMHYHHADGCFYDNVKPCDLGKTMLKVADAVNNKYRQACLFAIN